MPGVALYELLKCPVCAAAPAPGRATCIGCGRRIGGTGGALDLLGDSARDAADRFAIKYRALRRQEGWIGADGREDPAAGDTKLWRRRLESVAQAAEILRGEATAARRLVVADIGSGGGWAARYLDGADVIAIDLLEAAGGSDALHVRGDMRSLPVRDGSLDAALYIASLHYAPVGDAIREAARTLRGGGLIVAVDSPMYKDPRAQAGARARSAAYYSKAGFPELADTYHPIDVTALRAELTQSRFDIRQLDTGPTSRRWWERWRRPSHPSLLVARLMPAQ
ncbi:MAG TPA: class I SAM-dependent methyltransferase [Candidatus Dormibacteraeota bacterium]